MKTYVCRKLYLYRFLTKKGFEPFRVDIDKYDCKKYIWLYTDSAELKKAVDEYYSMDY